MEEVGDYVALQLSVKTIREVSLVKRSLEMVDITQILQSKSFAPKQFHESNLPKYLNASAFSR